jgi:hypothetical protein
LDTSFSYSLPAGIVTQNKENERLTYRLKIQKQPGTKAIPLTFRLRLPSGMKVTTQLTGMQEYSDGWLLITDLKQDRVIEVEFAPAK